MEQVEIPPSLTFDIVIGMPVYNAANFVEQSIRSILKQTHRDFIVLILDNASTDATKQICEDFAASEERVFYSRNPQNIGALQNFERVRQIAPASEFFRWQAHDDLVAPDYLEKTIAALRTDPDAVLAHCHSASIDEHGQVGAEIADHGHMLASSSPATRLAAFSIRKSRCLEFFGVYRRKVLDSMGPVGIYHSSDQAFLSEIAIMGKVIVVDETLFFNRDHENQASRQTTADKDSLLQLHAPVERKRGKITRFRLHGAIMAAWWRHRRRLGLWRWLRCLPSAIASPFAWPEPRLLMADLMYTIHPRLHKVASGTYRAIFRPPKRF